MAADTVGNDVETTRIIAEEGVLVNLTLSTDVSTRDGQQLHQPTGGHRNMADIRSAC
jgi:hypothetical protein